MNSIILCEGKTDAILLSYYLSKTQNWSFIKSGPLSIPVFDEQDATERNWYKKEDRFLAIWGVGGKDKFDIALNEILAINKVANTEQTFNKIAIVMDRDEVELHDIKLSEVQEWFSAISLTNSLENCWWASGNYFNEFEQEREVAILPIIIPFDKTGALETFLLDAIAENEEERIIVDASREFVAKIQSEKYLLKRRLRLKAELATTFALISPEKVFHELNKLLTLIEWEKYRNIQSCFQQLEQI